MKKNAKILSFVIAGAFVGYYVGTQYGMSGWDLFWEIFYGGCVGLSFDFAFSTKENYMFLGAMLGLVVPISLDYLAGSEFSMEDKLSYIVLFMFIGWYFRPILKPVLVSGIIGGVLGFVLGLIQSHLFGTICLPPGILNASLSFVRFFILGMAFGSLFVKIGGLWWIDKIRQKMNLSR